MHTPGRIQAPGGGPGPLPERLPRFPSRSGGRGLSQAHDPRNGRRGEHQYGGGPKRLREQLSQAFGREVPLEEAREVCSGWDRAYPAIAKVRDGFRQSEPWEVASPLGRRMAGHRLTKGEPGVAFSGAAPARLRSIAALAFPIQAAGAELLKETLGLLMPRLWSELHVVHDEILLEAPEAMAQAAAVLLEVMQDPGLEARYLKGVLPLVAEVKVGKTWAETH
jgi:DNA polymerase I-like protein with 3'-5' exonuclease and polymerase domains